ncbi:MAG: hypothetical protein ACK4FS_07090 [Flavobacterium sp.]
MKKANYSNTISNALPFKKLIAKSLEAVKNRLILVSTFIILLGAAGCICSNPNTSKFIWND